MGGGNRPNRQPLIQGNVKSDEQPWVGVNTSAVSANGVAYGAANGLNIHAGDIQGYDKLNRYRVVGDILRVN